jgi:hypothetical protein
VPVPKKIGTFGTLHWLENPLLDEKTALFKVFVPIWNTLEQFGTVLEHHF